MVLYRTSADSETDQKAVGKTGRNPEHFRDFCAQLDADPLAKMGGRTANIDRDVKNSASDSAHQLSLGLLQLKMQASQDMLAGARLVVLDKVEGKAGFLESRLRSRSRQTSRGHR